ncbi:hypothetical protein ACLHDF_11880 [Priestia aryabhattai]|uniref:hypothetical protein n=1 Tax=Priestia megaterium TaxID=1404 RepID=UPI0039B9CD62
MTNFYLKRQGARIRDNRLKHSSRAHLFLGKKRKIPLQSTIFSLPFLWSSEKDRKQ